MGAGLFGRPGGVVVANQRAQATSTGCLEHDPEKCEAVFRKDHAQTTT